MATTIVVVLLVVYGVLIPLAALAEVKTAPEEWKARQRRMDVSTLPWWRRKVREWLLR